MNYTEIANLLAKQKADLGISESNIAWRTDISQPTVHRILSGLHKKAAWDDLIKIGGVLGVTIGVKGIHIEPADEMLEKMAEHLARTATGFTQATNSLEKQGMEKEEFERMVHRAKIEWLAGPRHRLWDIDDIL